MLCRTPPSFGDLFQDMPLTIQCQVYRFRITRPLEGDTASPVSLITAIAGQTPDDLAQTLGQGLGMTLVLQLLGK